MTVYTLTTPLQYPTPDLSKIKASRSELDYKVRTLSTVYLPVLAEQLTELQQEIHHTDKSALEALTLVPVTLNNNQIEILYTVLQNLKGDDIEEREKAELAIAEEIKLIIDESLVVMQEHTTALVNSLINLRSVKLNDNQYIIKELQQSIESDSPKLDAEVKAIELLEGQETVLNTAIKTLESADGFDLLKDALLSADKLTALNLTAPQIELIKAGLDAAGKILGIISDALKYKQLIAVRKTIQSQLDLRRFNRGKYSNDIKTLQDKVNQLTEFQTVQVPRTTYTQELDTLADALNKFLSINTHEATDSLPLVVKNFVEHSKVFIPFLQALRKEWNL